MPLFDLTSDLSPFYLSENFICAYSFLQVWYPSLGADPYKQEDFVQVCRDYHTDCLYGVEKWYII